MPRAKGRGSKNANGGDLRVRPSPLAPHPFFNMIVVLGLSHHSSPVELRERFAFAEARVPAVLQLMRDEGLVDEAVILSTCNRVEIYASTSLDSGKAFA